MFEWSSTSAKSLATYKKSVQGLLSKGGTILGTTNRGNPFGEDENGRNKGILPRSVFVNWDWMD